MPEIVRFNFPTTIFFGPGARRRLPALLEEGHVERPLIVTDRGLAALPIINELSGICSAAGRDAKVYSDIWGNPVKSQVTAGVDAYKRHNRDGIVAVGGGAALDVAKVIALMVNHPGDLFDYEDGKPDARPVDRPMPFIVALPTTSGTGSEVGRSSVVSDDKTHAKKIIFDPRLLPNRVLADPELTLALPANVTAATGMDALTHLVEAFLSKGFHPMCDGIAIEGMRLVARSLKPCVDFARSNVAATPEHVEARGLMQMAAVMGAVAFQKGLGVTHSLAHALSTVCDLHHGLVNGILIPYTMAYNAPGFEEKFVTMAQAVGASGGSAGFITWLETLKRDIGIPKTLSEVGVKREHLTQLVDFAVKDGCHACNPKAVSRSDFERLFSGALGA